MTIGLCALALASSALDAQVTTAQYDNARTSADTKETKLTPRSVSPASFGKVASINVDGDVYAQVLYLPSVAVRGRGAHPVVFVATEHNSVYAFDAEKAGEPLWHVDLSSVASGAEPVSARDVRCPFIRPEVGITATPVIDTATNTIFVLARTKEGGRFAQRLHALDVRSGEPKHSAVEITATARGTGAGSGNGAVAFDPLRENPRAALLLVNGRVILSWASSCDVGPYHGWVMAYDARTLQQVAVLNTTPDGAEGGIWQGDAGLAADEQGRIYTITGNGTFDASSAAGRDFGDTVLQLTLQQDRFDVSDFFTPFNQLRLQQRDGDLGSGGPLLIPEQSGSHRRLLFFGGKGGGVYLLDRDRLGHFNPEGGRSALQTMQASGMVMGASAYWNGRVYSLWSEDVVRAFDVVGDRLTLRATSGSGHRFQDPGATPTVSANGRTDGIVWLIESKTWNGADRPAVLHAYDAVDLRELYSSEMNAGRDRAAMTVRFAIPTVAAGRVYVGTKGQIDVYGILGEHR
jgi:hypothetical protein